MGYTNIPTIDGQDFQDWNWLKQNWFAVKELEAIIAGGDGNGQFSWPPPNAIWSNGVITSVADNGDGTLTASMDDVAWGVDPSSECSSPRWVGYTCPTCLCYLPQSYDLIIEGDDTDPYTVVRGSITAQTFSPDAYGVGPGTLTIDDQQIKNAITAGFIPSLAYLSGKNYYIIKQGGLWSSDRWLIKPNQKEDWKGVVDVGVIDGGSTEVGMLFELNNIYNPNPYNDPTNPIINWASNQWAGGGSGSGSGHAYECMAYSADGYLHRLPIVENDSHTLFFGHDGSFSYSGSSSSSGSGSVSPLTLVGNYSIVKTGTICDPNRLPSYPFEFYTGMGQSYVSHNYDDTLGTTTLPATSAGFLDGTPTGCGGDGCNPSTNSALDVDVYTGETNQCMCGDADKYLAPQYYASLRSLQLALMGLVPSFVPVADYNGAKNIPLYTIARAFSDANINAWTSTASYVDADNLGVSVGITPPYYPYPVYWTIVKDDCIGGDTSKSGIGNITVAGNLQDGGSFDSTDDGKPMYLSFGFSREMPRQFRYLYGKTIFIPNCSDDGCDDPPAIEDFESTGCLGVGQYVYETNSSTYAEYSYGFIGDTPLEFVPGDLARHIGDNVNDPFSGQSALETALTVTPYWHHTYRGKLNHTHYMARLAQLKGISTSSNRYSITDLNQHWWTDWKGSGILRTESGNATGGSATTLVDNTKTSGADACFWDSSRFLGAAFPWQGFYLEIHKGGSGSGSGSGSGGVYKVPITGCDPTTGTLTFAAVAGLSVSEGDYYEIKEPGSYEPNTFAGRWLSLELSGSGFGSGGNQLILITGNDDDTLYFDTQSFDVPAGTPYTIIEFGVGTTWEWSLTVPTDGRNYVPVALPVGSGSTSGYGSSVGYWIQPVGTDGRHMSGSGSGYGPWTFKADQTANLATTVKRYGVIEKGDYITKDIFDEMRRLKILLKWTKGGFSWANKGEANWNAGLGGVIYYAEWGDGSDGGSFEYQQTSPDGAWPTERSICESGAELSTLNTPPFATYICFAYIESDPDTGTWFGTAFGRAYAYAQFSAPAYYQNVSIPVDVFDWGNQTCGDPCTDTEVGSGSGSGGYCDPFCNCCWFDPNGDPVIQNQYTNFYSTSVTTNDPNPYYSPKVGSTDTPDYPPKLPLEDDIKAQYAAYGAGVGCQDQQGYSMSNTAKVVIYKWDSILQYV